SWYGRAVPALCGTCRKAELRPGRRHRESTQPRRLASSASCHHTSSGPASGPSRSSAFNGSLALDRRTVIREACVDPEVLKKAPLFAGLEDDAATALSSAMGKLYLNKGDVLFHEGDSEDRLYIVVSGKIKLGR